MLLSQILRQFREPAEMYLVRTLVNIRLHHIGEMNTYRSVLWTREWVSLWFVAKRFSVIRISRLFARRVGYVRSTSLIGISRYMMLGNAKSKKCELQIEFLFRFFMNFSEGFIVLVLRSQTSVDFQNFDILYLSYLWK